MSVLGLHQNQHDIDAALYTLKANMYFRGSLDFDRVKCKGSTSKQRYYSGTPEVREGPLFSQRFGDGGTIVVLQRYE